MRILIITPHLNLRKGPYVWLRGLSEMLIKKGIDCHILVFNEKINEENVISYTKVRGFEKFLFNYPMLSLCRKIRTMDAENHYDIIHAIDPLVAGFNGVRIGLERKIPTVVTLHGEFFTLVNSWSTEQVERMFSTPIPLLIKIGAKIQSIIGTYAMSKTDKLVVPNNYLKDHLRKHSINSIVIPNAINMNDFNVKVPFEKDEINVLSISHMKVQEKVDGLKILIDAMELVQEEKPDVKLRIVGDGNYLQMLKNYSTKNKADVEFLGYREDIPELLNACTIYAHSSFQDIFPIALLEAMVSRKSIVATRVGGIPEVVKDNENGFLCSHDPKEISEKILLLLSDKGLRESLGNAGYQMVKEKYTWDMVAGKYINLYEELIET